MIQLEIIEIPGYTNEEKLQIALHYLVPQARKENGLDNEDISISDQTLLQLINGYTRESGVRDLGRQISTMFRKVARMIAEGSPPTKRIAPKHCEDFLGPLKFTFDMKNKADEVGLVTGLAWTQVGGEILPIEVAITKGKKDHFANRTDGRSDAGVGDGRVDLCLVAKHSGLIRRSTMSRTSIFIFLTAASRRTARRQG